MYFAGRPSNFRFVIPGNSEAACRRHYPLRPQTETEGSPVLSLYFLGEAIERDGEVLELPPSRKTRDCCLSRRHWPGASARPAVLLLWICRTIRGALRWSLSRASPAGRRANTAPNPDAGRCVRFDGADVESISDLRRQHSALETGNTGELALLAEGFSGVSPNDLSDCHEFHLVHRQCAGGTAPSARSAQPQEFARRSGGGTPHARHCCRSSPMMKVPDTHRALS